MGKHTTDVLKEVPMINILARLARWGYGSLLCAGLISLMMAVAATSVASTATALRRKMLYMTIP